MATQQHIATELLKVILTDIETKSAALYKVMQMVPFDLIREMIDEEEKGLIAGTMKSDVSPEDIRLIKMKYDMFETIYNEMHAFAKEMEKHVKVKAN
jgi:hypothetical protein